MASEPSIFDSVSEMLLGKAPKESIVKESVNVDGASDEEEEEEVKVRPMSPDEVRVFQVTSQAEDEISAKDDEVSVVQSNMLERAASKKTSPEGIINNSQSSDVEVEEEEAAAFQTIAQSFVTEASPLAYKPGTILEAAFVDPAYSWPPKDGEGLNAIELQASVALLNDQLDTSDHTTETMRARMMAPTRPDGSVIVVTEKKKWWQCCGKNMDTGAAVDPMQEYRDKKIAAEKARYEYAMSKRERMRQKEKEFRKKNRYNRVPEGILIYRLDTSTHELSLMSEPHSRTNTNTLVREMRVAQARPSPDRSRRGLEVVGEDGRVLTLVACEQRTATSWWEAINLMLAKNDSKVRIHSNG